MSPAAGRSGPQAPALPAPVVLAAGGTGGHVFPAQALAAELRRRGRPVAVVTDSRGAAFDAEAATHRVRAASPSRSLPGMTAAACDLGIGTVQAWTLLRRLKPAAVVGFGGYPSVPPLLAASWLRLPTLLHEQNAVLGRANRLLAPRVDRIATSFAEIEAVRPEDRRKLACTGNPVRPAIAALAGAPYRSPDPEGTLDLLVLGGSQGARVFSEVIPEAVAALPERQRARLRIAQQCRPEDLEAARARYAAIGVAAELSAFFPDVPERLAAAQLVIARAGASTVVELTAVGRPAILVPYPHAMDDHQTANARAVDAAGGAWLMPQGAFSPAALAARLEAFLTLPATLGKAAAAAARLGRPDAAARLADLVESALRAAAPASGRSETRSLAA